jgi:hypothetical protein
VRKFSVERLEIMRNLFVGWAALLFLASILCAFLSVFVMNSSNFSSIAMALASLGFSIAGGLALVAAAVVKED